jgi:hypothetical protein
VIVNRTTQARIRTTTGTAYFAAVLARVFVAIA